MLHARDRLRRQPLAPRVDSSELELAQVELALLLALALLRHELQVHLARRDVALEQEVEPPLLVLEEAVLLVVDEALDVHALAERVALAVAVHEREVLPLLGIEHAHEEE